VKTDLSVEISSGMIRHESGFYEFRGKRENKGRTFFALRSFFICVFVDPITFPSAADVDFNLGAALTHFLQLGQTGLRLMA
jgi:hypothetical protein